MSERRSVCVVLHDVAAQTSEPCERVIAAVREVAEIPLTLLVVPRYHGAPTTAAFEAWLNGRVAHGDELSLHGWTHRDDGTPTGWIDRLRRRVYTHGEGEFWALDEAEARARIERGIAWFDANRWPVEGFVAPAWLLGAEARTALRASRFDYTSTLREIEWLKTGARITSQSVVYSHGTAWRRELSLIWNALVFAAQRANPVLRIELHPRDADEPRIKRSWQRLLGKALETRNAVTVAQLTPTAPKGVVQRAERSST